MEQKGVRNLSDLSHDTKKKAAPITPLIASARLLLNASALLAVACGSAQAAAGETLAQVKTRGTLRCGVSEGIAGFSIKDAAGRWTGLDSPSPSLSYPRSTC